jgi:uncharacterized protein (UPF0548 family)
MFFLTRPSEDIIHHFLAEQESSRFSYPETGASRQGDDTTPHGYVVDHNRIHLGVGVDAFERAKQALRQWKMFEMPWVQLCWPDAPIQTGTNVAVLISHFGFWSFNAARIVYTLAHSGPHERYGFAYGTLLDHGEQGEERFTVEFHPHDESVWYDLFAFSRPRAVTRLAYPLARSLQKRFARDSLGATQKAVKIS